MRPITTLFMALLATVILTACTKEQPAAPKPAEPAPATAPPAVEAAKQATEEIKQKVEETAAAAKTEAKKSVEAVKEQAAAVTEQAKAAVAETAGKVKQESEAAATAVPPAVVKPAVTAAKAPKVVSYAASMGKVTFDHAAHAGRLACSKCHQTEPPANIVINKEIAHALCKGCHQTSGGKAPTACSGCHVK